MSRTWNHRVVRRYSPVHESVRSFEGEESSWLEVTEVHYQDGVPCAFANLGAPQAASERDEHGATEPERELLKELRWTLERMLAALDKPILDQKKDFGVTEPVPSTFDL